MELRLTVSSLRFAGNAKVRCDRRTNEGRGDTMTQQYALTGSAAELYEHNMVPAVFQPFAEDLVDRADLKSGQRVLDIACGTGIVVRLASPTLAPSERVVGLDRNASMLDVARRIAEQRGAAIEWVEADATAMPLPDSDFDAVLCQFGIPYFPDRPKALTEMYRVLKPGGRLTANVLRAIAFNPGYHVFAQVLDRHVSDKAAATRKAPFQLWNREEIRGLVEGARFQQVAINLSVRVTRFPSAEAMVRMMMAGTPLGAEMANADARVTAKVIDDVASGLADYEDDFGLALPMQAWIINAVK
jgi:ubiquinone/menaquinone biosynthesis C-methylase UbiE